MQPPVFLKAGDLLELEVEGVGAHRYSVINFEG
jgi:hypothetical protein